MIFMKKNERKSYFFENSNNLNRGNNIIGSKHYKNNFALNNLFFKLIISLMIISESLNMNEPSYITMKLPRGYNKIIDTYFSTKPDEIFINEKKLEYVINSYQFNKSINEVKIIWNKIVTNCHNMFYLCKNIIEIDLSHFNTSQVTNMVSMFENCESLNSLDLSNFDTSKVLSMLDMFFNCYNLKSLNISSFKTSRVEFMYNMFRNCISLTSINISHFDVSNVIRMDYMFDGCLGLKILDISNFNIPKVINVTNMFGNCGKLEYINIYKYESNTILENNYYNLFKDTSKNLVICTENANLTSIINNDECHIVNCLDNWYESRKKINIDDGCCIDNCNMTNNKYEYEYKCYSNCISGTYNNNFKCEKCHPDCIECNGPYTNNNTNCISCNSSDKFLYLGNCISYCLRDSYYDENIHQNVCKCELPQCSTCSIESLKLNLCTSCEKGYYPIYNNYSDIYKNCSISTEGYYYDNISSVYKLCYKSCQKCDKVGDDNEHNCIECKHEYNFEINFDVYKNCYDNCTYYHYYDESKNISLCTSNFQCPKHYEKLIEEKKTCVTNCTEDNIYKYEFQKKCYDNCPLNSTERKNKTNPDELIYSGNKYFCKPICNEQFPFELVNSQECIKNCPLKNILDKSCVLNYISKESEESGNKEVENKNNKEEIIKEYDMIIENIEIGFTSNDFDTSNIEKGNDDIIENKQMTITLTTTKNQKNDKNNINKTIIELGDCEYSLKKAYDIPENESLFIKKLDINQDGMQIPKIEYDVYYKLNGTNLVKLNLSFCKKNKMNLFLPVKITENIDVFNLSSGYYRDICYTATSDDGTDLTFDDRKKEFFSKNRIVCQENCDFSDYDYNIQKAKCSCEIKESSKSFANMNININQVFENFIDIKNKVNIKILRCYKVLFSTNGIIKNYGNFIMIFIILFHFIFIIIFKAKNKYNDIQEKIKDIIFGLNNSELVLAEKRKKRKRRTLNQSQGIKNPNQVGQIKESIHEKIKNESKIKNSQILIIPPSSNNINNIENPPRKKNRIIVRNINDKNDGNKFNNIQNTKGETNINPDNIGSIRQLQNTKDKSEIIEKTKKIMSYNDKELNDMSYESALKYDKRSLCEFYMSLLKTKHILIFTFFNNTDYNIKIIKIDLFLINFSIYIFVNALFFSDKTMHKIHEDKGSYNIIYQLPQIIYSSIISSIINILLKLLALSEGSIIQFKQIKDLKELSEKEKKLNYELKMRLFIFFIISTIFLFFFWYYLSMFCSIYVNTQIHLLKDTLISFSLSFLYPFVIYLLPGFFRIPSLSKRKNKRNYLYNMSKIIQLI